MAENADMNKITELLALNDEINNISRNIKQLIEGLHSTSEHIGNLRQLTGVLATKVGTMNDDVNNYKPIIVKDGNTDYVTPSWVDNGGEQERIVPTPENYKEFQDVVPAVVKSKPTKPAPSIYELQEQQLDQLKYNTEEDKTESRKQVETMMKQQQEMQANAIRLREEAKANPGGVSVNRRPELDKTEKETQTQRGLKKKAKKLTNKKNVQSRKNRVNKSQKKKLNPKQKPVKDVEQKKRPVKKVQPKKKWFGGNG